MTEINSNQKLAELLIAHGIAVRQDDEFIYADLPLPIKLKARVTYNTISDYISSRLDVMVISEDNQRIIESFGDIGIDVEEAINRNFTNFSMSSLHVILAAFGANHPEITEQITIEEWAINGKHWRAYIGNLLPKTNSKTPLDSSRPMQLFNTVKGGIESLPLSNNLHWFRGYYFQHQNTISNNEFLIDNEVAENTDELFSVISVIPDIDFFSCRIFIILRAA